MFVDCMLHVDCRHYYFMVPIKHILTSAECGVTNKDVARSQKQKTGFLLGLNWCAACNIFVLTGYDVMKNAYLNGAPLWRTKYFTPHEEAFKHGYKYNIGIEFYEALLCLYCL